MTLRPGGAPPAGPHGGDGAAIARWLGVEPQAVLDLSASLNPFAPDLRPALARAVESGAVGRYPDDGPARAALAERLGRSTDQVVLTNGGAEAIALVAAVRPRGWVEEPEFSLYRRHLQEVVPCAPRWRSDPHNPSGRLAPAGEQAEVWDEAFYALATGRWGGRRQPGSVVVGSLTKLFACPGLRIGYVATDDDRLLAEVQARRPQWSVNGLAAAVLPELLDRADLEDWHRRMAVARAELAEVLRRYDLRPRPSDANWLLVDGAGGLRAALAAQGVAVRDCSSFGMPGTVRIAVPDEAGLARLDAALARWRGTTPQAAVPATSSPRRSGGATEAWWRGLRGALLVCGTGSDAGKSAVVTGLCRLLARHGVAVAPFKAQNMALNSWVTAEGAEIGRAQAVQAEAAGAPAEWRMNPVLLKPTGERRSQVVVAGRPVAEVDVVGYRAMRHQMAAVASAALADLRARYDVVICEGAGSPAEINLLDGDFVNLGLAVQAGMAGVVVGDIDRGGVFASLYGTVQILPPALARRVGGFVVNKFRGDPSLLAPGLAELTARTAVPVLGVLPWLGELGIDAEDSLALEELPTGPGLDSSAQVDVAVVRLPHLANATDVDALRCDPAVSVRLVERPAQLGRPDLVVLPGTKTTVADLQWLRQQGLDRAIAAQLGPGGPLVLAICGGFQMAGRRIDDPVESQAGRVDGLGWLPVTTTFEAHKLTRQRRGAVVAELTELRQEGAAVDATALSGYEIRHGRPEPEADGASGSPWPRPWLRLTDDHGSVLEGMADPELGVLGTSLHGLLEHDGLRLGLLQWARRRRGRPAPKAGAAFAAQRQQRIDRLADAMAAHLDMTAVAGLIASAARPEASVGPTTWEKP